MESMKRTKQELKKDQAVKGFDGDAYPWGLRIRLENDAMKKLGLTEKDFEVGKSYFIGAKAECRQVSIEDDGKRDVSISLQVTDLSVKAESDSLIEDFENAFGKE